jgi:hypothetical protein
MPYVCVVDQKAQNTAGGTFTTGADQTRTLNTITADTHGIAFLASNQLWLPAGTYRFAIAAPAYACQRHQAWLYNITLGAVVERGTSGFSSTSNPDQTFSFVKGRVRVLSRTAFEVRHRCGSTSITQGFGVEANFGVEVYTQAEFWGI